MAEQSSLDQALARILGQTETAVTPAATPATSTRAPETSVTLGGTPPLPAPEYTAPVYTAPVVYTPPAAAPIAVDSYAASQQRFADSQQRLADSQQRFAADMAAAGYQAPAPAAAPMKRYDWLGSKGITTPWQELAAPQRQALRPEWQAYHAANPVT